MPKIFLHYPEGAFEATSLSAIAEELTTTGLDCEHLPNTPFVRSTVCIYTQAYAADRVFVGGLPNATKVVSLEVNVFEGGLNDDAKQSLIERFTAIIARYMGLTDGQRCPVYVLIRETPAANWGVFGDRITLEQLRRPPADGQPV